MELRPVRRSDKKLLYGWRHQDETEARWYQGAPANWQAHSRWVDRMMDSPAVHLWIGTDSNIPVGQVRVDSNGEVSYSVDRLFRGRGYGADMLREAQRKAVAYNRLKASVDHSNVHGAECLVKAGFDYRPDVDFYLWKP